MPEPLSSLTEAEKIISDAVNGGADISLEVGSGLVAVIMIALNKMERQGIEIGKDRGLRDAEAIADAYRAGCESNRQQPMGAGTELGGRIKAATKIRDHITMSRSGGD